MLSILLLPLLPLLAPFGVNAAAIPSEMDKRGTPSGPITPGLVTRQVTTTNSWSYAGCQWSPTQRALTGYSTVANNLTPDNCAALCESKGFAIAGVEWGNTCWCGNSIGEGYGLYEVECQKFACTGDSKTYCGGATAVMLYTRGAAWTSSSSAAAASTSASISASAASASASASAAAASTSASISASVASASASASAAAASQAASIAAASASTSASVAAAASKAASISAASASASASVSAASASASIAAASVAASIAAASASASASVAAASAAAASQAASIAAASASASASVSAASASASAAAASTSASISASIASASASASAAAAAATIIPSPWVRQAACVAEGSGGRALTGAFTAAPDMTYNKCLTFCSNQGFGIASLEYSSECRCGNQLVNGASLTKTSGNCNMACSGSPSQICGGPDAQTVFVIPSKVSALAADLTAPAVVLPAGWAPASTSCVAEGTSGRALTGAFTSSSDMTGPKCVAYCQDKGFPLAGVEFGNECRCGYSLDNGASLSLPSASCNMGCAGDSNSICGGPLAITLYSSSSAALQNPVQATSNGFKSSGCIQEVAGRALTGKRIDFADMTIDKCTAACSAAGFSMAGVEYGVECYCGNTFDNGASKALISGQCYMSCPGNPGTKCGGPNAIQLYSL